MTTPSTTLLTFGHGTADQRRIVELLQGAEVEALVDVRRFPGSRRHPHTARDEMSRWLPEAGIAYRWDPRLGGRRSRAAGTPDAADGPTDGPTSGRTGASAGAPADALASGPADALASGPPDPWWQVSAFGAYAAHMRTDEFRAGAAELLDQAREVRTVVMCSETVWWRCHRRLVSDAATLLHDADVQHLGHDGRLSPHRPAAGARLTPHGLVYDLVERE